MASLCTLLKGVRFTRSTILTSRGCTKFADHNCKDIAVVDVSGGCGSMYEVHVEAPDFKNMRIVKQHQLVTKALAKEIKDMHGIRISTSASKTCGEK